MKPTQLIFLGSVFIGAFTLICLLVLLAFGFKFDVVFLFIIPVLTGIATYSIFYFFIRKYLSDKLKVLYRSIRKGKFTEDNEVEIRMNDDVILEASDAAKEWSNVYSKELTILKEQEAFRREFLGNLAHELKTPMFSIQGYILSLLEGGLEDPKVNRKFLQRASIATERMLHVLEDLDEITAMEVNTMSINRVNFDLIELCREVMLIADNLEKNKKIQVQFAKPYDPIDVNADRVKIGQVLTNLIHNSIFYGKENGSTTIRIFEMDNLVTIDIADDGPGIDETHIPRLFERFYRVEKSRNRNEGGSGLGLAIVKHILEAHDQRISVRTTVGVGSTFSFSLDRV